jgi:hypothetical protein
MVIARLCAIASLFFWKMSLFPAFKQGGKLRIASAAEAIRSIPALLLLRRHPLPAARNRPSLHLREQSSSMKNRTRETCTSGTVRDEGGNILIYSANDRGDRGA